VISELPSTKKPRQLCPGLILSLEVKYFTF
jgi:hypothetical protein